jgi:Asp-tRNA(Asn)/Glu-tRNA(Gln) amidotransferase B subunit
MNTVVIKPTIYLDTYDEVMEYIKNENNINAFIFESVEDFIKDDSIEIVELNINCKEINKVLKIIHERKMVPNILEKLMERLLKKEQYEKCVTVKELMDKFKK